jgi:hypothetical protein
VRDTLRTGRGRSAIPLPSGHLSTREVETTTLLLPICSGDLVEAIAETQLGEPYAHPTPDIVVPSSKTKWIKICYLKSPSGFVGLHISTLRSKNHHSTAM